MVGDVQHSDQHPQNRRGSICVDFTGQIRDSIGVSSLRTLQFRVWTGGNEYSFRTEHCPISDELDSRSGCHDRGGLDASIASTSTAPISAGIRADRTQISQSIFLGNTSPKSDAGPWSQNGNNGGNTMHCPTAFSPNSELMHDNVYNVWIMEKRITAPSTGHNYQCVAVSNIDDISQSTFSWFAYEYDLDAVIPTNSHGSFYYPDYPQVGLWQSSTSMVAPYTPATDQALWISYDLLDPNNANNINGVLLCAVDIAGLRASTANPWVNHSKTPACAVAHPLTTFNQRRSWVPANNSDTTPPISADGEMFTYMIEPPKDGKSYLTDPNHTQGVEQWTINWSSATPTPTFLASWDLPSTQPGGDQLGCFIPSSYYNTACIPQPSTSATGIHIDSVADRMQQFFHYTSQGGQGSIWTSSHDIQITPSASGRTQTEADIRVLQRNTLAPNSVFLAGDYPILDPSDRSAYVFLPSIARDKAGNLLGVLGTSGSGGHGASGTRQSAVQSRHPFVVELRLHCQPGDLRRCGRHRQSELPLGRLAERGPRSEQFMHGLGGGRISSNKPHDLDILVHRDRLASSGKYMRRRPRPVFECQSESRQPANGVEERAHHRNHHKQSIRCTQHHRNLHQRRGLQRNRYLSGHGSGPARHMHNQRLSHA